MAKTYTTLQGDTWDVIAQRVYGDDHQCSVLMVANPDYKATMFFSAGVILNVPEIVPTTKTMPQPPWHTGQ